MNDNTFFEAILAVIVVIIVSLLTIQFGSYVAIGMIEMLPH